MLRRNKKGVIFDVLTILGVLIAVAMTFFVGKMVFNEVVYGFQQLENESITANYTGPINYTMVTEKVESFDIFWEMVDYGFLVLVIGLTIALIMSAMKVNSHPAFIILNIIGLFILLFLAIVYTFVWNQFILTDVFTQSVAGLTSSSDTFTRTGFIMQNYPWFALFIAIIGSIIMYSKSGVTEGG